MISSIAPLSDAAANTLIADASAVFSAFVVSSLALVSSAFDSAVVVVSDAVVSVAFCPPHPTNVNAAATPKTLQMFFNLIFSPFYL